MNSRLLTGLVGLATLCALSTAPLLSARAAAQQGPPPSGPQGGVPPLRPQNRPGAGLLMANVSAKVTIDDAAKAATDLTPGFVSMAQLRIRPNGDAMWIVHVVTKPASGADKGSGKIVIVDGTSGKAREAPAAFGGAGRRPGAGKDAGNGGTPPPAKPGGSL